MDKSHRADVQGGFAHMRSTRTENAFKIPIPKGGSPDLQASVRLLAPGWTDSPLWDAVLGSEKENTFKTIGEKIPFGRIAQAAKAVLSLMVNGSINAELLHIDGGHRLI